MSTVTENDLKELKDLLNKRFDQVDQRFDQVDRRLDKIDQRLEKVETNIIELKVQQADLKGRFEAIKPSVDQVFSLSEKVGELKNWRQFVFTALTVLTSGTIGWYLRK